MIKILVMSLTIDSFYKKGLGLPMKMTLVTSDWKEYYTFYWGYYDHLTPSRSSGIQRSFSRWYYE